MIIITFFTLGRSSRGSLKIVNSYYYYYYLGLLSEL